MWGYGQILLLVWVFRSAETYTRDNSAHFGGGYVLCYVLLGFGIGWVCLLWSFFWNVQFRVKVFDVWRFDSRSRSHLARLYIPTDRIFLE